MRSALAKAERILADVNEETRRYENVQKLRELSRIVDMESYGVSMGNRHNETKNWMFRRISRDWTRSEENL